MDFFTLICSIIGAIAGILAVIAFRNDHSKKPAEERDFLILQFRSTRSLSISVTERLEDYCLENNAYDKLMFESVTFRQYITLLKQSQETNLSEEMLQEALSISPTAPMINSMVKSLENQFNELLKIDTWLKVNPPS